MTFFRIFIDYREYNIISPEIKEFYYEIYENILPPLNRDR